MKIRRLLFSLLSLFIVIPLTSCSQKHHEISEYILETDYKKDMRILQFSDIHLANKDDWDRQFNQLQKTIDQAHPDFIVITGDSFTFGSKTVAKEYFAFLDKQGCPWTITWGNHDEQCYFSIDWLTGYLNDLTESGKSNCLFKDIQDDDVFGNANFAINLKKDGKIFEQIIMMDSNRYHYGGLNSYTGYDYIKEDQIAWYENLVNYTTEQNDGNVVESMMFFHIPLPEYEEAWNAYLDGSSDAELRFGEKREGFAAPEINTGMFDKILELGSTKCISVGHDHENNHVINYKGVDLGFGVNSSDRIYYTQYEEGKDLIGGRVIVLSENHTFDYEDFYSTYEW